MNWLYYEETLTTYSRPQGKRPSRSWLRLYFMLAGLIVAVAVGLWLYGWVVSMRLPRDPRPEVQRFVDDIAVGKLDLKAINAYRTTLPPHERDVLHQDINYLLRRRGAITRLDIDYDGQIAAWAPETDPFAWQSKIIDDVRAGRQPNLTPVSYSLHLATARGDTKTVRDFMDSINAKLRPLGKAGTFERGEFRIVTR